MIKKLIIENFKNFKKETVFSFEAGNKRELKNHIMKNNKDKILPIKVIYGNNSVGKTNIVMAFKIIKSIILNKHLKVNENDYINLCSNFNSLKDYESPVKLNIVFDMGENEYNYLIKFQNNFKSKYSQVIEEILLENEEPIFKRIKNNITFSENQNIINNHYKQFNDLEFKDKFLKLLKNGITENDVFTSWFNLIDKNLCNNIIDFFTNKLIVINKFEELKIHVPKKIFSTSVSVQNKRINKLLKELELKQDIFFEKNENDEITENVRYILGNVAIETMAEATESKGTLKLIDLLIPLLNALKEGATIIIDELDASIHHEIIVNLIQTFGDENINKNKAQLVFTTHNPVYMNKFLLRRDEIVFVEKEKDGSIICTLDDYNIRNDEVYLKNYLNGEYTILPDFDIRNIIDI